MELNQLCSLLIEYANDFWSWAKVPSNVLPVFALTVSYIQWRTSRRHNRLSVKPYITDQLEIDRTTLKFQVSIVNAGLGPAILDSFTVLENESPLTAKEFGERVGYKLSDKFNISQHYAAKSAAVKKDESKVILSVECNCDPEDQRNRQLFHAFVNWAQYDLRIHAKYQSAYGEKLEFKSVKRHRPDANDTGH